MSKMKEWLLDRQENGDDGTEYPHTAEVETAQFWTKVEGRRE
jgi:hypothetical protein